MRFFKNSNFFSGLLVLIYLVSILGLALFIWKLEFENEGFLGDYLRYLFFGLIPLIILSAQIDKSEHKERILPFASILLLPYFSGALGLIFTMMSNIIIGIVSHWKFILGAFAIFYFVIILSALLNRKSSNK